MLLPKFFWHLHVVISDPHQKIFTPFILAGESADAVAVDEKLFEDLDDLDLDDELLDDDDEDDEDWKPGKDD